jgi:hypothetical protein
MTDQRPEDAVNEAMEAFFGAEAMAEVEENEAIVAKARREDGIDYSDVSLWGGREEFLRHRNECRAKRGLPPVESL